MEQKHGAKAWFDLFTQYLTDELNHKFSAECPRLGKFKYKRIILIHVDDLIFTGDSKYINEICLPKIQGVMSSVF